MTSGAGPCSDFLSGSGEGCSLEFDGVNAGVSESSPWFGAGGLISIPSDVSAYNAAASVRYVPTEYLPPASTFRNSFAVPGNTVGFVNNGGEVKQQIRDFSADMSGAFVTVSQIRDYTFSAKLCSSGEDVFGTARMNVEITANGDPQTAIASSFGIPTLVFSSPLLTSVVSNGVFGNASCNIVSATVPHYELFSSLGRHSLTVSIVNSLDNGALVFFDEFALTITDRAGVCVPVFINEINFVGSDTVPEAIEIVAPVGTDATDVTVELLDFGDTGDLSVYAQLPLSTEFDTVAFEEIGVAAPGRSIVGVAFPGKLRDGNGLSGAAGVRVLVAGNVVQTLCYGPGVAKGGASLVSAGCTMLVDVQGVALNDTTPSGSVQLFGCGACFEHFDYREVPGENSIGTVNSLQAFCDDADGDGFWHGVQQGAADSAGKSLTTFGAACCGGNDCHSGYAHIHPNAPVDVCDGFDSNCDGDAYSAPGSAVTVDILGTDKLDEVDLDGDGRLQCDAVTIQTRSCSGAHRLWSTTQFSLAEFPAIWAHRSLNCATESTTTANWVQTSRSIPAV